MTVPGCVSIPTIDDSDVEGLQQLRVSIVTDPFPTNVFPLSPTEQNVTLTDNDGLFKIHIVLKQLNLPSTMQRLLLDFSKQSTQSLKRWVW